jgi:L-threonylcarbamoyladenylate synthase
MTNLQDQIFIEKLNNHLKSGGVIAFQTDTVWGLGALPTQAGVNSLFEIKNRPSGKYLIVMSNSLDNIKQYMSGYPVMAFELANKYWPGALTIGDDARTSAFSVRVPNFKPFWDLCDIVDGHCLATTSANLSGQPVMTSADEIRTAFPDVIIIDGDKKTTGGLPSTVVVFDGEKMTVVRQGSVIIDK